jgi:hypothetical protein
VQVPTSWRLPSGVIVVRAIAGDTPRTGYRRGMRFMWAALAVLPFALVLVGMLTGRLRARSCCATPAELDARLRDGADGPGVPR